MSNKWIKKHYPIQDDTWPSRRWNRDMTESCDMSGERTLLEAFWETVREIFGRWKKKPPQDNTPIFD